MAGLENSPAANGAMNPASGARGRAGRLFEALLGGGGASPVADGRPASDRRLPGRRLSIHVLVVGLSIAVIGPAIGFFAYIVNQQNVTLQQQANEQGTQLASDIADRLEQELESLGTMLAVFASSGWLEADELHLMHHRATRALSGTGRHLIVLDENLDQLMNTRAPFGTPLGKTANTDIAEEVLQTGEPAISDVFIGRVAAAPVFDVLRPVTLPDGRERVLILTRTAATLDAILRAPATDSAWSFVVLDGSGQVVTGHPAIEPGDVHVPAGCMREAPGPQIAASGDGEPRVFLRLVDGSEWRVCAWSAPGATRGATHGETRSWTPLFTAAAAAWIAVAIVTAVLLSAIISRSIARTARIGASLGSGAEVPYVPSIIAEVDDVRRTLAGAAAERVRNEHRLNLLLREAAHRARNQIALSVSLVDLSARHAASPAELQKDLSSRLLALGRSVDALTGKAPDTARLGNLVTAQLAMFVDDHGERLATEGEEVLISERAAQTLSLVLHELATNASKYGAWAQPKGRVTVRWHMTDESLILDWSEAGAPSDSPEKSGFGTKLMETLVERGLSGQLDRSFGADGFRCRIVLPRKHIAPEPGFS